MNCADAWNARLDAQCRMAEMLSRGGYESDTEREPVCEICGARLSCWDLLYDGHTGHRHAALGCGECCAIDDVGNIGVRAYIDKKLAALENQRVASAAEVMQYLTAVMRREKSENIVVTVNEEVSAYEPDQNGTMRKVSKKQEVPKVVEIPAKLSDANKAAELLGKRYALFTDRVDLDGEMELSVRVDYGDNDTSDVGT